MACNANENDLQYSTATQPGPGRRRYVSALHAVSTYLELEAQTATATAMDYERAMWARGDADPSSDPLAERVGEKLRLEVIIDASLEACADRDWQIFVAIRLQGTSTRDVQGVSHTEARRAAGRIKADLEERLVEHDALVTGAVDDDEHRLESEQWERKAPAAG